jgi:hypothetical protein
VTTVQKQLPNLFDVAVHSRLRGATTPGVVLNVFPPFMMEPSILAKNVGGLKQNFIAARSLLDSMTVWFYCATINKNVP